jgi:hypothetical protein
MKGRALPSWLAYRRMDQIALGYVGRRGGDFYNPDTRQFKTEGEFRLSCPGPFIVDPSQSLWRVLIDIHSGIR